MANLISKAFSMVRTRATPNKAQGAPSTAIHGGFIQDDERNASLVGTNKYIVYSDILANVSIVGASVRFFLNLIGKAKWTVQPADDSPEAVRLAELVDDILHDMATPWPQVVRRSAMFRFWGFSIQE